MPLHMAAQEDATATAEVLLNRGADVHANNNYGKTPLDVAVSRNAHKTAEVLRRYGGRNNKSSSKGNMGCSTALVGVGIMGFVLFFLVSLLGC